MSRSFFSFLAFLVFVCLSCSATLWNKSLDEIKKLFAEGNYTFLRDVDVKTLAKSNEKLLGPGAAYALGLVFDQIGRTDVALTYWRKSFDTEGEPWKSQASKQIAETYRSLKDWDKLEAFARELITSKPSDEPSVRLLLEALYWQKKDAAALAVLDANRFSTLSDKQLDENLLFYAVVSARLGKIDQSKKAFETLIFEREASAIHYRAFSFFEEDLKRYDIISPTARKALAFQSVAYSGQIKDAIDFLTDSSLTVDFWNHRVLVTALETLFKSETYAEKGLLYLEKFRTQVSGPARFAAEYARGRFYRSLERWKEARSSFQAARPLAQTEEDKKRTAWNWLQAWVKDQSDLALPAFRQVLGETSDPGYFSDVVATWLSELVQKRSWEVLSALWRDLGPSLLKEDRMTVGFVLARLSRNQLIDLEKLHVSESAEQLLKNCIDVDPYSYEALVARSALGLKLEFDREVRELPDAPQGSDEPTVVPANDDTKAATRDLESLVQTLLTFGLVEPAARLLSTSELDGLRVLAVKTAVALQKRNLYRPSLILLYRTLADGKHHLVQSDWELLYPLAFSDLVEEKAGLEGIEPSLLFGLMREESSFDPRARSWVGAQGLTQLMPQTAADVAKRMKLVNYDLLIPQDNISIGAKYLSSMIKTQERIFLALMAYNAGGNRIKPWKVSLGALPEEIFVEAVPFTETRYYVKKVLSSTVMYGVLYHHKTISQMVQLVYPNFQP